MSFSGSSSSSSGGGSSSSGSESEDTAIARKAHEHLGASARRLLEEDGSSSSGGEGSAADISDGEEDSDAAAEESEYADAVAAAAPRLRLGNAQEQAKKARREGFAAKAHAAKGEAKVATLVARRDAARARKDWAEADRLRDEIEALGVGIQDQAGALGSGASDIVPRRTNQRTAEAKDAKKRQRSAAKRGNKKRAKR
jgi:cysteinyl-tRNA synthetase